MSEPVVLRDDDPRVAELIAAGWRVAHRSWGARLVSVDRPALEALVRHATEQGYRVLESDAASDAAIASLEARNRDDYPGGPATAPLMRTVETIRALRSGGTRFFVAMADAGDRANGTPSGPLVAVTAVRVGADRAETDFTSVLAQHRRRGLAEAVKAASVLALHAERVHRFGTGGADENFASIAMNRRLGYAITERWLTLVR